MNDSTSSPDSSHSPTPRDTGFSPWQRLKTKRISYLTLPLLIMATVTEFVILATGWKYQQVVCLPQGMGVTFFGIGPIGATILAVELLKLPLAIWTASRAGWQKGLMVIIGLPLICLLTFQLVKDMAVYEMGVAMTPAAQMLEKATAEETKIAQLNGELAAIEGKKTDREHKLAELAAKETKAKADLDELLKRNDDVRHDAISLTEYQQKELSDVAAREAAITRQFNADTEQITKSLADLHARREPEADRAIKWNAEEARIENAYKAKMADYTNKKTAYDKDKAEYDNAGFLKRQLLKAPVDPGVPPEREVNKILKPVLVAEIDAQIKAKEAELLAVNNKRRDRLAQVDADARKIREEFDRRSGTKREEADRKREELSAAQAAVAKELKAQQNQVDQDLTTAVQKVDGIRAEIDAAKKRADGFYMAREAAIRNTQVHRIATTVEIVRGLLKGERPMSIKATAKERGDILTDQISMVRIWVYPVLAFIVAFLPTLMVEIGFSTVFHPEVQRPPHRLGFFGRHLHWLYIRAGRQKILRAERQAREASAEIALRGKMLAEKEAGLQTADEAIAAAAAAHEKKLKQKEGEWGAKIASVNESLNQALVEKEALLSSQQLEIDRQVQLRQNAWTDRLNQLRQELDSHRATSEAERAATAQEHQKKLQELSEEWRNQIIQANRQVADAELGYEEKSAKLAHELKEALKARDAASSQLQLQAESFSLKLTQAKADAARELEKAARQEKHRLEQQQTESAQALRQTNKEFEHQLKQREQELSAKFEARLAQDQSKVEQDARRREEEFAHQLEVRIGEVEARWTKELQQREETTQARLKQREKQLQAQAEVHLRDAQTQAEEQLRRRELEFERGLEAQTREAATRLQEELHQQDLAFHERLKQREQALNTRAAARETELQNQWATELRSREEVWAQQTESRIRAVETRLAGEAQQKEEAFQQKLRQREHQLQSQSEARQSEQQAQWEQELRRRVAELAEAKQRELDLVDKLSRQAEAHHAAEQEWKTELDVAYGTIEPLKALLVHTEKAWDSDMQSASAAIRHVQDLKQKLNDTSSALNGLKSLKN